MIQIDMEMPKSCDECPCVIYTAEEKKAIGYCNTSNEDYYCKALDRFMEYDKVEGGFDILGKPSDCPLKEVSDNSVLEDIKAEMEKDSLSDVNGSRFIFVRRVNEIIDNHINGKCDKPSGKWVRQMKSEIADALEFWDYSPNNNPLARDILETVNTYCAKMVEEQGENK